MIPAQGCVKNYHWGKVGSDNYIAKFQQAGPHLQNGNTTKSNATNHNNNNIFATTANLPLAELWFGSHPSGPAMVKVDNEMVRLDLVLAKNPELIGTMEHYKKFDKKLPFLFKILSVEQPLSLQAHPDKRLAQILHNKDPKNYPDANHKPELCIALTKFEVLCDFRPIKEIATFVNQIEPLRRIVGPKNCENLTNCANHQTPSSNLIEAIRASFKCLMTCDKDIIASETKILIKDCPALEPDLHGLIVRLAKLYPGDPGIFAPFFLNHFNLSPGQAIYLKANKLHAYIGGECIECMACSDNVVRAGLTSKYRDVATLIDMLDYEPAKCSSDLLFPGHQTSKSLTTYAPSHEFKVDLIKVDNQSAPDGRYTLGSLSSGSFIVVMNGKAMAKNFYNYSVEHQLGVGSAGFVPPKTELHLTEVHTPLVMYRAYC